MASPRAQFTEVLGGLSIPVHWEWWRGITTCRADPSLTSYALEENACSLMKEGEEGFLVQRPGFSILAGMHTVLWDISSADKEPVCPRNALQSLPRNL